MPRSSDDICQALGAEGWTVTACHPLTAGASAETWRVVLDDRSLPAAILRLDAGGEQFGMMLGKANEALAQAAALGAGAPCARVLQVFEQHPLLGDGYLMEALPGESLPPRILKGAHFGRARAAFTEDCARALAHIHRADPNALTGLPLLDARSQATQLYQVHRDYGEALPVFSLVHAWLMEHAPECPAPTLVHGDFRLGNVLLDEHGLTGVLDWEMAHRGDPMEDLGWLCVNAWRFGKRHNPVGGIGQRETLYKAYEAATGSAVCDRRVRYWELLGNFKWGVVCQYQAWTYLSGQVPSIERAAIGRRVAETEYDMLECLQELEETRHAN